MSLNSLKPRRLLKEKHVEKSIECPKRLYSYINQKTKGRGNIPALWRDSSTLSLAEDDYGRTRVFSNYFDNVITLEMSSPPNHANPPHMLDAVTIKEFDVFALLKKFDIDRSMAPDEIHPRLSK